MGRFSSLSLLTLLGVGLAPTVTTPPLELRQGAIEASFEATSRQLRSGAFQATLDLTAAGCAEAPRALPRVSPKTEGSRVVYRHEEAGVEEWYTRDARGIEQGFTFAQAPDGCAAPSLRLEMNAKGGLTPAMDPSGSHISFRDERGVERLTYSELHAFDRAGRELPATMEIEGTRLALVVDTKDAEYPIVVDPLVGVAKQVFSEISLDPSYSVSVAVDGDLAAVGIPDDDDKGTDAGAVALYKFSGGAWVFKEKIFTKTPSANANCGRGVAMAAGVLIVGCPGNNTVQVWDLSKSSAVEVPGAINPLPLPDQGSQFGATLSFDGQRLAILAHSGISEGPSEVYVFENAANSWTQSQIITQVNDYADSIALRGNLLAIGFPYSFQGNSVQIWEHGGSSFSQAGTLTPPSGSSDYFGSALATDGTSVFIGNPGSDGAPGQVHIAESQGGIWGISSSLTGPVGTNSFGQNLALDGSRLVVLASDSAGKNQIFGHQFSGGWQQDPTPLDPPGSTSAYSLSLAFKGGHLVVGAPFEGSYSAGRAHFFEDLNPGWDSSGSQTSSYGSPGDKFGSTLSWNGDSLFVGAPRHSSVSTEIGLVSLYQRVSGTWTPAEVFAHAIGFQDTPTPGDHFGTAVVSRGDWAFISAPKLSSNQVMILHFDGQTWAPYSYLGIPPGTPDAGSSMDFDGTTLAVRSSNAIHLFVYEESQGIWILQQTVVNNDTPDKQFGTGGRIRVDGDWLFSPAVIATVSGKSIAGQVYVFKRNGSTWQYKTTLKEPTPAANRYFGIGIAVDVSNQVVFINANTNGSSAAAIHVFKYDSAFDTWSISQTINNPVNPSKPFFGTYLGTKNGTLISGSTDDPVNQVYFFRESAGNWGYIGKYQGVYSGSGRSVEVDGNSFIVGASTVLPSTGIDKVIVGELLLDNGATCSDASECASNFCVDGVCCNKSCSGTCQTCVAAEGAPADGTCGNVSIGAPDPACAPDGNVCGFTGTCNGQGACSLTAKDTLCEQTCSDSSGAPSVFSQVFCDGAGACTTKKGTTCGLYSCAAQASDALPACLAGCTTSDDCISTAFCDTGSSTCISLFANGKTCELNSQCASNFCVDGVCCNTACDGVCQTCIAAEGAPADGTCGSASVTTIDAACNPTENFCGFIGTCDGNGACAMMVEGTSCGVDCSNEIGASSFLTSACDGLGNCTPKSIDCGLFLCGTQGADGPLGCLTTCATSEDCVAPAFCNNGVCEGQLSSGTICELNSQCASGNCVDGVCCDTACDGACQACSIKAGGTTDGVCEGTCLDGVCVDDTCQAQGGAGGESGAGGSDAGSGGSDAGSGGSDAGAGGSDAGSGGDAGAGGDAGQSGSAGKPGKGLPDLWNNEPIELAGAAGAPAGAGGSSSVGGSSTAGAAGAYQRPKVTPLQSTQTSLPDGCSCRTTSTQSSTPSLAWLAALGLLASRRNRRQ